MSADFYLASHDYVSSPEPRECQIVERVSGTQGRTFYLIEVVPRIVFEHDGITHDIDRLFVLPIDPAVNLAHVGSRIVMVDLLLGNSTPGVLDEGQLFRLGMGTVHKRLEDAKAHSPL